MAPGKVIFLDVDGVLHPFENSTRGVFLPECMRCLKLILDETGASLVLSSSWQCTPLGLAQVDAELSKHGIPSCIDRTVADGKAGVGEAPRAREIVGWAARNADKCAGGCLALDDLDLLTVASPPPSCEPLLPSKGIHFVHVDEDIGLTPADAKRAIAMLGRAASGPPSAPAAPLAPSPPLSPPSTSPLGPESPPPDEPSSPVATSASAGPSVEPSAGATSESAPAPTALLILQLGSTNDASGTVDVDGGLRADTVVALHAAAVSEGRMCQVLVSGGSDPLRFPFNPTDTPHWSFVADLLVARGLPPTALLSPGLPALHTVDEALMARAYVQDAILVARRGGGGVKAPPTFWTPFEELVVVTSCWHAPRARHLFGVAFGTHAGIDLAVRVVEASAVSVWEPSLLQARRADEKAKVAVLRTAPFGEWAEFVAAHGLTACNRSLRHSRKMAGSGSRNDGAALPPRPPPKREEVQPAMRIIRPAPPAVTDAVETPAAAPPDGFALTGINASELRANARGGMRAEVAALERQLAFFAHGEKFYAIDADCPHQGAGLELGEIEEVGSSRSPCVACPRHGWTFDLQSGYCEDLDDRGVRAYEVRQLLPGGELCVALTHVTM
jgi:nitrite reductase/ring-hydroxylating ferredoxin subunit/uncharacterized SAM-binding protein YcdF (DUF218 family)